MNYEFKLYLIIESEGVDRLDIVGVRGSTEDGMNFYLKDKGFNQSLSACSVRKVKRGKYRG